MPSLFYTQTVDAIFNRIHNLRPDTGARWGTMTPATMLQHCRIITESMLLMQPSDTAPSLKQRIIRSLILGGLLRIPRGRNMPGHIARQMETAGSADFNAEFTGLLQALEAFATFEGTMNGAHPHFGRMSHTDWGRFAWVHLDHHLRQFGV